VSTNYGLSRIDAVRNNNREASFYKWPWPIIIIIIIIIITVIIIITLSVELPYLGCNFMLDNNAQFSSFSSLLVNWTALCYLVLLICLFISHVAAMRVDFVIGQ